MYWIFGFYLFCLLNVLFLLVVFQLLNSSKFRSEDGDTTTEIGYGEDSLGLPVFEKFQDESSMERDLPHVPLSITTKI